MPHDHDHGHDHGHGHGHPNTHAHMGHNGAPPRHLHSHMHGPGQGEEGATDGLEELCATFIDGFREAEDKVSFLRLAGIPFEIPGEDGLSMKLVDVALSTEYQVGTASPGFASEELVYMPYTGALVRERVKLDFVYVSLKGRRDVPLAEVIGGR